MKSNGRLEWPSMECTIDTDSSASKPIRPQETSDYVPDRKAIFAQVEGDMELFAELVELFLDSYPAQLEDIRQGIADGDSRRVREASHSLKGSVGNFQATTAVALAADLEVMGRDGDLDLAPQKLTELEAQLSLIKIALTALRIEVAA